jgi:hypothetical protein
MAEDLSKYLDDEPSVKQAFVARKQTRKSNTATSSGWDGGYSKPRTYSRPKGETGTGKKSSGARARCEMEGCQAFQSPARSGYCSWHESQHLAEGEQPKVLRSRKCRDCSNLCSPPEGTDDESILCDGCAYFQNHPDEWSLDNERPLSAEV